MFYDGKTILEMDEGELLSIMRQTIYPGSKLEEVYRLGDVVMYHSSILHLQPHIADIRERQIRMREHHRKHFPNSIAAKYTNLWTGKKSFKDIINHASFIIKDVELVEKQLNILKNLCDEVSTLKPSDTSLVATLRLGDMLEGNYDRRDGKTLAEKGGTYRSFRNTNIRHILSAKEIIKAAKEKNLDEVILLGGHTMSGQISLSYLKNMVKIIEESNLKCRWFHSQSPDEDFAFISNSKHHIVGPGGYAQLAGAVARLRKQNF